MLLAPDGLKPAEAPFCLRILAITAGVEVVFWLPFSSNGIEESVVCAAEF